MNIITVDFETYYDKDFSLSKMTTEEYIRDPRFEVIGVSVAVQDEDPVWFSGTHAEISAWFQQFPWEQSLVLAHNCMFDGAILSWLFNIKPKGWLDTLSMGRALHNTSVGGSLAKLATHYDIGVKGTEVANALGMRRIDFSPTHLLQYGEYCKNDVALTRNLFYTMLLFRQVRGMGSNFPTKELKVINTTLSMYIHPTLELNLPELESYLEDIRDRKESLLSAVAVDRTELMSNDKFATLLRQVNVSPPYKISPTTGKTTYAFAKTDEEFQALQEHPDFRVQALVAARLGLKSTLEETRTERFINIAKRGKLPVPIRYYAAHTGRFGGDDKINLQNLPSRGQRANRLKAAIRPPKGHVLIDADSSQIEARIVAWLAGQQDLVDAFEQGRDVYKIMASSIYHKPVEEITDTERFFGKTVILGCGYGMGAEKFYSQMEASKVATTMTECERIIRVYREQYAAIPKLWDSGKRCLVALTRKQVYKFDVMDLLGMDPEEHGFLLPSGLWQRYPGLNQTSSGEFLYDTRTGPSRVYGGKLVENLCQAVARCAIVEQMLQVAKRYRPVLTVHDSIVCTAPEAEAEEAAKYVMECMRWRPEWAKTLPLTCEVKIGTAYGLSDIGKLK